MTGRPGAEPGVESLYPFLYGDAPNGPAERDELVSSTAQKADEIVRLRDEVLDRYADRLAECADAMARAFARGSKLLAFGNGGSSTDAQEVARLFLHGSDRGRPVPALALTADIAVVTALANDVGFDVVFARQIAAFGRPGDIAIGLSTSGNSANLVEAFARARSHQLVTVGLAGGDGGTMARVDTIDFLFIVPSSSIHRIQEAQTTLYHVLWELTQASLAALGDEAGDREVRP
jgi:D-sedoheptulose 7-phosphate isomerase